MFFLRVFSTTAYRNHIFIEKQIITANASSTMASNSQDEPPPPVAGIAERPASPVSEMTTPSSTRRRYLGDQERINDTLLSDFCGPIDAFSPVRRLFAAEKPHFTWDNYFSGDSILDYACQEGFGLTMTCRRDRLPRGVKSVYWNKERTPVNKRSKAARFENPVFAIKKHKQGTIQVTSFQSTSSCNLISVNALNSLQLYAAPKERGRGKDKRHWGIEMNESRKLYLGSYGKIDKIDHLIKNCNMHYRYDDSQCFFVCIVLNLVFSFKHSPLFFFFQDHGNIGIVPWFMRRLLQLWWHTMSIWNAVKGNYGLESSRLTSL